MAIPTTHSDDPNRIRREVVERLLDVTNARSGLYHETTEVDGVRFYVKVTAPGPAVYQSIVDGLEGTRLRIGAAATCGRRVEHARREAWSIHNPSRLNTRTFCLLRDDIILERFRELPVWTELYEPAQITTDQLRVLIFQEGRHVGWLGVFRATGESRFDVVHRARANRERAELQRQLLAARTLDEPDAEHGSSLLFSAEGRLLFASPTARALPEDVFELLRRAVQRADRGALERDVFAFGSRAARILRMDAPGQVVYLVRLEPAHLPRLRVEEVLTPRQLEVAELAATGATIEVIADALRVRATTVKYHLREAYRRLGVENRAELARLFADA